MPSIYSETRVVKGKTIREIDFIKVSNHSFSMEGKFKMP